jgi:hypothetical protein
MSHRPAELRPKRQTMTDDEEMNGVAQKYNSRQHTHNDRNTHRVNTHRILANSNIAMAMVVSQRDEQH